MIGLIGMDTEGKYIWEDGLMRSCSTSSKSFTITYLFCDKLHNPIINRQHNLNIWDGHFLAFHYL